MKFCCRYARSFADVSQDNRDGVYDDEGASRTIRMGFTDRIVVSHALQEVTETLCHGRKHI